MGGVSNIYMCGGGKHWRAGGVPEQTAVLPSRILNMSRALPLSLSLVLLATVSTAGCAVVAVADAAVSVTATAVSTAATVVGTTVDVAASGVRAVTGAGK